MVCASGSSRQREFTLHAHEVQIDRHTYAILTSRGYGLVVYNFNILHSSDTYFFICLIDVRFRFDQLHRHFSMPVLCSEPQRGTTILGTHDDALRHCEDNPTHRTRTENVSLTSAFAFRSSTASSAQSVRVAYPNGLWPC